MNELESFMHEHPRVFWGSVIAVGAIVLVLVIRAKMSGSAAAPVSTAGTTVQPLPYSAGSQQPVVNLTLQGGGSVPAPAPGQSGSGVAIAPVGGPVHALPKSTTGTVTSNSYIPVNLPMINQPGGQQLGKNVGLFTKNASGQYVGIANWQAAVNDYNSGQSIFYDQQSTKTTA